MIKMRKLITIFLIIFSSLIFFSCNNNQNINPNFESIPVSTYINNDAPVSYLGPRYSSW